MIDNDNVNFVPSIDGEPIPLKGYLFIEAEREKNSNLEYGTLKLYKDLSYDQYSIDNVTQDGIVKYAFEGSPVIPGDKVYGHHFMCDMEYALDVNGIRMYKVHVSTIVCVIRDGEIAMVGDWNLITPIEIEEKTAGGIFIPQVFDAGTEDGDTEYHVKTSYDENKGPITHLSYEMITLGVNTGDMVYWTKNSDYLIKVEGKKYFRMKDMDIVASEKTKNKNV